MSPPLEITRVPTASLRFDEKNPRTHDERNLKAITDSLKTFGQAEPLIVQKSTLKVIGGNGRLQAMRALGWDECDVVILDIDDVAATALGITLNKTAELADWDMKFLGENLAFLKDQKFELLATGFDISEYQPLIDAATFGMEHGGGEVVDPGAGELPREPVSRRGDLWLLGTHRLLCGDSTDGGDVALVMNGEKASLLATDPPYLVGYKGGTHPQSNSNNPEVRDKDWGENYKDPSTGIDFLKAFLQNALAHCRERVAVYQWHAHKVQSIVESAWNECGLLCHQQIIWVKARPVLTRSHYMWQHEPAFYGWPSGKIPELRPPPNSTTVWDISQQGEQDGIHPTQKPIEIFLRPINCHTREGEICLEPFSGSGSQLIAAEKLVRRCYAIEISPAFVDVAILRWQRASGKAATLESTGRTYAETAEERKA